MSKLHWLAFTKLSGIGGATARCLLERFGSIEAAWDAPDEEWCEVPRITPKMASGRRTICLDALENELALLADEGLRVVTWEDDDYPANLRPVGDAPPLLFVRGTL